MATTISCAEASSFLRCSISPGNTQIQVIDPSTFVLYPDQIMYLEISHGNMREIVLMVSNPDGDTIQVARAQVGTTAKWFPQGACVRSTVLNCLIIRELIQEEIAAAAGDAGDIRPDNNVWTGTNVFTKQTQFYNTVLTNTTVDGNSHLLNFSSGVYILEGNYVDTNGVAYGAGIGVFRKGGSNFTVGAQIVGAHEDTLNSSEVWGIACEGIQTPGSHGSATGIEASSVNMESSNVSAKAGIYLTFKNRWDYQTAPVQGLGANQYNTNSVALMIGSQTRSIYGEFCGWNKAISFQPGALDEAQGGVKAIGIDFGPITNNELARIDTWIRLRATKGVEWNGDASAAYIPIITYFDPLFAGSGPDAGFNGRFNLTNTSDLRFGINVTSGVPYFNDSGSATNLISGSAGADSGSFLLVNIRGNYYKVKLYYPS